MAAVRGLAFTPKGDRLISAGADKDIRVWDLADGRAERILRGQISDGWEGAINALALSNDGRALAVAGWMARTCPGPACGDIRMIDPGTGAITSLLSGHSNVVLALAFSPDGDLLASASADRTVKIWDVAQRRQVASIDYPAPAGRFSKIAFLNDRRHVVAASDTADLHVLNLEDGRVLKTLRARDGTRLHVLAVSADGSLIAAGGEAGGVVVWRWPSAEVHRELAGDGKRISALAFGRDKTANVIVASSSQSPYLTRIWDLKSAAAPVDVSTHDNIVSALAFSHDGTQVATAGGEGHTIRVWSPRQPTEGRELGGLSRAVQSVAFITDRGDSVASSPNLLIGWGHQNPCPADPSCPEINGRIDHVLRIPGANGGNLGKPETWPRKKDLVAGAARYNTRQAVTSSLAGRLDREQGTEPLRYPRLVLERGQERREIVTRREGPQSDHKAYTFDAGHQWIVTGGRNGSLEIFELSGARRAALLGHSADIEAVVVDQAGRLVLSGSLDQTMRLWNAASGEQVASILRLADGRWIIWTPQGYFDASAEGEKLIGWQINRGPDKAAEFVSANDIRAHFYQPKLVERAIALASAEAAIKEARAGGRLTNFSLTNLARPRGLPMIGLLAPKDRTEVTGGRVTLSWARPAGTAEIKEYQIYVNDARIERIEIPSGLTQTDAEQTYTREVPLYGGRNTVKVVAVSVDQLLWERSVRVTQIGEGELDRRETLYVVAIGVDKYPNCKGHGTSCGLHGLTLPDLDYAGKDARTFAELVIERMGVGKGHKRVVSRILFNGAGGADEPTSANVADALAILTKASERDTSVLFISGHGDNLDHRGYHFLPTDASRSEVGWKD